MEHIAAKLMSVVRNPSVVFDFAAYRSGLRTCTKTAYGGRLWANSFSELKTARNLALSDQELRLLNLIPESGIAFDIGAHIGIWTVPMARHRPNAQVLAFEGAPKTFARLKDNVERNNIANARAFHCAIADAVGTVSFQSPQNASVFGRISAPGNSRGRHSEAGLDAVPCTTIAAFCAEHGITNIDFMKIDVEGAERDVLRGATPLLRRRAIKAIWMEIEPDNQADFGSSVVELADLLDSVGYGAFRISSPDVPVNIRLEHDNNMLIKPLGDRK